MSRNAIPKNGCLYDGIKFLSSKESILSGVKKAEEEVKIYIEAIRNAKEPNQFKTADDETICKEIIRQIDIKT